MQTDRQTKTASDAPEAPMEWQKLSDTPEGYSLWTKLDDTGREIFKYQRTHPNATEGGYYNAESAAKLKNLTPSKAQHSPEINRNVLPEGSDGTVRITREDNPTSVKIREAFALGKFEGRASVKAHADKLAARMAILIGCAEHGLDQSATHDGLSNAKAIADAREALAAYEAAQ